MHSLYVRGSRRVGLLNCPANGEFLKVCVLVVWTDDDNYMYLFIIIIKRLGPITLTFVLSYLSYTVLYYMTDKMDN